MTYKTSIIFWPDGVWCYTEEYKDSDYSYKSDDYISVDLITEVELTEEMIKDFVVMYNSYVNKNHIPITSTKH